MNIYTYYEDVKFNKQTELLAIWEKSWKRNGFNPIILGRKDAEKSSLYDKYYEFVQRVHRKISDEELPDGGYWLAAQLEIVAFTTVDCPSYMSDYDIINKSFYETSEVSSKLHWRDNCCSCFASGDGNSWKNYALFLMDNEDSIVEWCLQEKEKTKRKTFGDQDFLIAIHEIGLDKNVFRMSRELAMCEKYFPKQKSKHRTYHISHRNMHEIKEKYTKYKDHDREELRILMGEEILCT
jgi:hypothetical protein